MSTIEPPTQSDFREYLNKQNKTGSNKASSYMRAMEILHDLLSENSLGFDDCRDIWSVTSVERLKNLNAQVKIEQKRGEDSPWFLPDQKSYLHKGFISAALVQYCTYIRTINNISSEISGMNDQVKDFNESLDICGLSISEEHTTYTSAALITKPFVILTGLSGSGKTKLAQAYSTWICENGHQFELIAVGADWTSNENLLGYPDALRERGYRKPDNGALDLILRAVADSEHPYFLILDEMNLSHVERYFADFLSAMESGEPIHLHEDTGTDWDGVPAELRIPDNLFVIGTVNIDETTYMFSPKVLDRANVIEFRVSPNEMEAFLSNPVKPNLDDIAGQGASYAKSFVAAARQKNVPLSEELRSDIRKVLMTFFPALQAAGAEFGYRTAHEICRFVYFHKELSGAEWSFDAAMDAAVMQKLLPKLHGSKKKLGPVLAALIRLCLKPESRPENDPIADEVLVKANAIYPVSLAKLKRMRQRLAEHGFTSFAEA